jgi:hypothetical protein
MTQDDCATADESRVAEELSARWLGHMHKRISQPL